MQRTLLSDTLRLSMQDILDTMYDRKGDGNCWVRRLLRICCLHVLPEERSAEISDGEIYSGAELTS